MGNPRGDLQSTVEERGDRQEGQEGTEGSPAWAGSSRCFQLLPSWFPRGTVALRTKQPWKALPEELRVK